MPEKQYPAVFKFKGGHPALDFCNTVHWRRRPVYNELLTDYDRLIEWATAGEVVSAAEARQLKTLATERSPDALDRLKTARDTRDALYRFLAARLAGQSAQPQDHAAVSGAVADASAHADLVEHEGHFILKVQVLSLETILRRVMLMAGTLLTTPMLERVGQCQDPRGCGWLFLDTTRNHSRRWCAMDDCGSLDKARRYYHRGRDAAPGKRRASRPVDR